jgi:hypothetical protein
MNKRNIETIQNDSGEEVKTTKRTKFNSLIGEVNNKKAIILQYEKEYLKNVQKLESGLQLSIKILKEAQKEKISIIQTETVCEIKKIQEKTKLQLAALEKSKVLNSNAASQSELTEKYKDWKVTVTYEIGRFQINDDKKFLIPKNMRTADGVYLLKVDENDPNCYTKIFKYVIFSKDKTIFCNDDGLIVKTNKDEFIPCNEFENFIDDKGNVLNEYLQPLFAHVARVRYIFHDYDGRDYINLPALFRPISAQIKKVDKPDIKLDFMQSQK